jgi:hypothetical protein
MDESWSGDVVNDSHNLTNTQVIRLMKMTELLRDKDNMKQIVELKENLETEDEDYLAFARTLWSEFTEEEQVALWVAPTFGGIFTTEERKRLRPGDK